MGCAAVVPLAVAAGRAARAETVRSRIISGADKRRNEERFVLTEGETNARSFSREYINLQNARFKNPTKRGRVVTLMDSWELAEPVNMGG